MVQPLILQYYQLLPEHRFEEEPADWPRRFRKALLRLLPERIGDGQLRPHLSDIFLGRFLQSGYFFEFSIDC